MTEESSRKYVLVIGIILILILLFKGLIKLEEWSLMGFKITIDSSIMVYMIPALLIVHGWFFINYLIHQNNGVLKRKLWRDLDTRINVLMPLQNIEKSYLGNATWNNYEGPNWKKTIFLLKALVWCIFFSKNYLETLTTIALGFAPCLIYLYKMT